MSRVVFERVTKHFGEVVAVDDLSLEVHDQEFLVLLGPSGCGKSTALRLVAGLEEPTAGTIVIGDRVVNNVEAKNRDLAMVFQDYALYPHMSVYDNLAFSLRMRRIPRQERQQRVLEAARILGLEELLRRKPAQLSGGQRQRVALGRSIVRQPSVFLMDEPLSNLDAKLRVQTRRELIKLHRRLQTTFIYVTHDQVEAMTMGERIAILCDGALQQLTTPREVYERPANLFVAAFIGSPAMNFFQAELEREADRLVARSDGVEFPLSPAQAQALAALPTRNVTIGVRPEHIGLGGELAKAGRAVLAVVVDMVESLGSEQHVTFSNGDSSIQARLDPSLALREGEKVLLMFAHEHLHFFDPETGLRVEDK
ncbi:MAG: sn-glycerol-3-phosphate ABC transporter ATP-binding protein UgpC [Chloroflexota bacterium]|nr:sn-glycerol-3-phosphate ABC transporter ATP-binding protein UgpC [Chloroflexota bacterium]